MSVGKHIVIKKCLVFNQHLPRKGNDSEKGGFQVGQPLVILLQAKKIQQQRFFLFSSHSAVSNKFIQLQSEKDHDFIEIY